jgi:hypothetical protein
MKKISLALLFCLAMTSLLFANEKPTEESLIRAWEELQKSDPNTVNFKKITDHRYKFKTNLFPFDGELKVNDATIENIEMGPYNDFIMGPLDVELVDLPKDVPQKYTRKYSMWVRNNTLYYDKKAGKWLSPQEFQSVVTKMTKAMSRPSGLLSNYIFLAVLLFALAYVIYFMQKNRQAVKTSLQRQADAIARVEKSIELSEKGMQLSEETNKILKEILEVLKSKG